MDRASSVRMLLAGLAAACLAGPMAAPITAAERMVWPPPPEPPRVEFMRAFSTPDELGIEQGFLQRLRDWVFGAADRRFVRPMAVVADRGTIFVADPGAKGIHRLDRIRGDYSLITGPDRTPLPSPVGLARGADGDIYVTDSVLAAVFVIRRGAAAATPLALAAPLKQPTGIAFDAGRGRLVVSDTAEHRLKVFAGDGSLVGTLGGRGSGPGEFNFPTHLWMTPQGQLHVADSLNFRIQRFDAAGRHIASFGRQGDGTGDAARPKGVATDRFGHIYVADALFHAIQIFDEAGRLLLPLGGRGREPGSFSAPAGLFIDHHDNDTIYVADSLNRRIQILRYIGGPT